MKIWFTEIGEPLPIEKDCRLHRYGMLTRILSSRGQDIIWWTSSFSHAPKRQIVNNDTNMEIDGVRLNVIKGPGYPKNVSFRRIIHQRHFAKTFYKKAKEQSPPDLIISPVPTIEAAAMAIRYGQENRVPVLVDIRDEWPDEFVNLSPLYLRWLARLLLHGLFRKMSFVCRNATGIIAMSNRQLTYGLRFANREPGTNDAVFPHGYSLHKLESSKISAAREWWLAQGIDEADFICCFFGTIGNFFNLQTVIGAASVLSKDFPVKFVLCGDGGNLHHYKRLASNMKAVLFPGWVDEPKIVALMEISDVGLAPYASNTSMSLPNKPFEYFAGGLPVVSSIQGELKEILADHDCGRTYQADSVEDLCRVLREMYTDEAARRDMGKRARLLLEREYAVEVIAEKMERHLLQVIANKSR